MQKAVATANAADGAIASDGVDATQQDAGNPDDADAAPLDDATDEDLALPSDGTDGTDVADAVGMPDVADAKTDASPDADIGPSPCPTACDDGNPCTDDGCNAAAVCTHTPNTAKCNDGNVCTTGDVCKAGACASGPPKNCSDDDACTTDTCTGDGCASTPTDCDDKNPCTDDACDTSTGCVHTPHSGGCDDGDACTTGDKCSDGKCIAVSTKSCDDGNPCTKDLCDPSTGCVHTSDDFVPCAASSKDCPVGQCVGGDCQVKAGTACQLAGTVPVVCPFEGPCAPATCTVVIKGNCTEAGTCNIAADGIVATAQTGAKALVFPCTALGIKGQPGVQPCKSTCILCGFTQCLNQFFPTLP